jgi:hypothetical protein
MDSKRVGAVAHLPSLLIAAEMRGRIIERPCRKSDTRNDCRNHVLELIAGNFNQSSTVRQGGTVSMYSHADKDPVLVLESSPDQYYRGVPFSTRFLPLHGKHTREPCV